MTQTHSSAGIAQNHVLCDVASEYEIILNIFVSDDDIRHHFLKPFVINDYAMATDAHCMVYFDKKFCPNVEPFTGKDPKGIIGIIPSERNECFDINIDFLRSEINKSPLVDEYKITEKITECDACDGSGEVEYEFSHGSKYYEIEHECPVCEGEGEIVDETKIPTGNKVIDMDRFVKIKISTFSIRNMLKLIKVAELLKEDKITLTYMIKEYGTSIFKIGNVEVLVMPVMANNSEMVVCHIA